MIDALEKSLKNLSVSGSRLCQDLYQGLVILHELILFYSSILFFYFVVAVIAIAIVVVIGTLANLTQCLKCKTVTEREEMYYDLLLQVTNCEDIAKSFRSYLAPEVLDGCNSYACDVCGDKQSAYRRVAIKTVPSLLTISCQRFDIDRTTWQRVKVISKNEFPLALVNFYFLSLFLSFFMFFFLTINT